MSKGRKLGKDFGLLTIGNFASRILSFLLVPLYTSILTTEEYGIIDIIGTTVNLVYPIAIVVISEAVIRFCLEKENDKRQVWTIAVLITLAGCVGMILLFPLILLTKFKAYMVFFILHGITMACNATVSQFVKGNNEVAVYAIGGVIHTIVVISLNIVFLLVCKLGLTGYLLALILGHIAAMSYYAVRLKLWKFFIPLRRLDKELGKRMVQYAAPMIPNSISWWISDSSDKYIVQHFCGLAVNGIYAVAYKIPSMLTTVSNLFISAWQLSAFEDFESDEAKQFFSKVSTEFMSFILIVAGGLILMTRPIAYVLYAKEFFQAWQYTPTLILAFVFSTVSSFWGTVYTAAKKTTLLFYSTMAAAAINIILDIVLTPQIGAMGAAIATMVSYFVICAIRIVESRKIIMLDVDWTRIIISLLLVGAEVLMISDSMLSFGICAVLWMTLLIINREMIVVIAKKVLRK